jgi:hypothetical protein
MNYWIFTAAPHKDKSESYTAKQIFERRMPDHFWGLGEKTPNQQDDIVATGRADPALLLPAETLVEITSAVDLTLNEHVRVRYGVRVDRCVRQGPIGFCFRCRAPPENIL